MVINSILILCDSANRIVPTKMGDGQYCMCIKLQICGIQRQVDLLQLTYSYSFVDVTPTNDYVYLPLV